MKDNGHPNVDLMRRAFKAATGGKVKEFWKHQDTCVEARVAGDSILSGIYRGKGDENWIPCTTIANLAVFQRPKGAKVVDAIKLLSVLADDDHAVAIYTVKTGDGDELGAVIGQIREGKFARVWHFDPIIEKGIGALAGDKNPDPPPPPKPKESFTI
jgi:hypothetical protein